MENDNPPINIYSFLSESKVEKHFAALNTLLLSGKHIDQSLYNLFTLLEEYYDPYLKHYYENLYKLNLVFDGIETQRYYYLDFFDSGKGKVSDTNRHRELTALQTLIGLMLCDMYHQKYFDIRKTVKWKDIEAVILESDLQNQYQKVLFGKIRTSKSYDDTEWSDVKKNISRTIESFDRLGWVEKIPDEDIAFEIKPAINRLTKLYQQELENFTEFVNSIKSGNEE